MKKILFIVVACINGITIDAMERVPAQSLEAYEQWLKQFEGAHCEKSDKMTFWQSPLKDSALNIVTRYSPDDQATIPSDIDEVVQWARKNHTPTSWILAEDGHRKAIEQQLQARGFTHLPLTLMVHQLRQLPNFWPTQRITSADELDDWLETFDDAFENGHAFTRALKKFMQSELASQDEGIRNEHYGCYLYDKLATTGSLYLTPDYAEICNIGTKKGARNNGMATVMIAGLLHRAQEAHVPHVFLTAAQEAQNIYKKAGFVPVAQADRYILEP